LTSPPRAPIIATRSWGANVFLQLLATILSWMFLLGLAGCVMVIPIVAYRLFSVLFEPDREGET
jgi:hypothetical protein